MVKNKKIYEYFDRVIVQIGKIRYNYNKGKYGNLINRVVNLSYNKEIKIYNYYEFKEKECWIYLWNRTYQQEYITKIDIEDFENVKNYYWQARVQLKKSTQEQEIRVIAYAKQIHFSQIGKNIIWLSRLIKNTPKNLIVDHIDGNPLNNCKNNLRKVTIGINNRNQRLNIKNTSGVSGVCYTEGKWRARIINPYTKKENSRYYNTFEEACIWRWEQEDKFGYIGERKRNEL